MPEVLCQKQYATFCAVIESVHIIERNLPWLPIGKKSLLQGKTPEPSWLQGFAVISALGELRSAAGGLETVLREF